jgi:hypothetical protein
MVDAADPPRPEDWTEDDELSQRAYYHLLNMWERTGGNRDIIATKGGHISIAVGTADVDMSAEKDANGLPVEQRYYFIEYTGTPGAGIDVVFSDLEATYFLWNNTDQILTMKTDTDTTGVAWAIGELNIMATETTFEVRKLITIDGSLGRTAAGVYQRAALTGEAVAGAGSNAVTLNPGAETVPVSGDFFVFQDTGDGSALKKVDFDNMPGGGGSGGSGGGGNTLNVNMTAVGNVTTGEDTLITYTMPADTLDTDGNGIRITAWGTTANNGDAKTLKMHFGGTVIGTYSLTISQAGVWFIDAQVYRTGSNAQQTVCKMHEMAGDKHDLEQGTATETDGSTIVIKVTGEGTSSNDIVQEGMVVEMMSSSGLQAGAELKDYTETRSTPSSSSGTLDLDFDNGNVFVVTLTENVTTMTVSNPVASGTAQSGTLILTQHASSPKTVVFPTSAVWNAGTAATVTATNSAVDIFTYITVDGGTTTYWMTGGQAFA